MNAQDAAAAPARRAAWYVEAFLAVGGWIAGLFAAGAIFGLVATFMTRLDSTGAAAAVALIGAAFVIGGAAIARRPGGDFLRHFAIAAIAAGFTAFAAGAWYLAHQALQSALPEATSAVVLIGNAGLATCAVFAAAAVPVARRVDDGILTFLLTLALFAMLGASLSALHSERVLLPYAFKTFPAASALVGVFFFTRLIGARPAAAAGAAMMIGPMLFYDLWSRAAALGGFVDFRADAFEAAVYGAAVVYCLFLLRRRFSLAPILGAALLLLAGVWHLPASGAVAIVILLAGMASTHRGLAAVGVVALAFFLARFYHDLSLTLLAKSAILAGLGAATLFGALLFRRLGTARAIDLEKPAAPRRNRPLLATLAYGALLAGSLGIVNRGVVELENAFSEATVVLLPLGPVDPRSIIQGDYMVLNFRETIYPSADDIQKAPEKGEVFLARDADGVASFSRFAAEGDAPAADEIRIDYVKTPYGAMRYCPESFFFQEGEAEIFAAARFAAVEVAPDGRARLFALADEDRKIIEPKKAGRAAT